MLSFITVSIAAYNKSFDLKTLAAGNKNAANQIVSLSYNRKMYIAPDVQLEFFDAGHILGSAFANVTINPNPKEPEKETSRRDPYGHQLILSLRKTSKPK